MLNPERQQHIGRELSPWLPATLALLNLADTKRRNLYLGHERVDQDLAELDQVIRQAVSAQGAACRIGGDQWLLVLSAEALPTLQRLVEDFARTEQHLIRFCSWAQQAEQAPLEAIELSRETIQRQLRCVYTSCSEETLWTSCLNLEEYICWAPVGQVIELETLQASERPENFTRWRCIDDYQRPPLRCLICQGDDFEWTGGTSDCAEGHCQSCGAAVDFRWGGA